MSVLEDTGLLTRPPMPLRRPSVWMALMALSLLLSGLVAIALPDGISGPMVWTLAVQPVLGLHMADVVGFAMLAMGSTLIWIISLIRQWQYTH